MAATTLTPTRRSTAAPAPLKKTVRILKYVVFYGCLSLVAAATETELWNALAKLGPNVLVYVMSFMTLGIFWDGRQVQLNRFAHAGRAVDVAAHRVLVRCLHYAGFN